MSEKPHKNPPLAGVLLDKAIVEMEVPSFFERLTAVVQAEAGKRGLLNQGQMLPGGEDCAGMAGRIAADVVSGKRQWKNTDKTTFFHACTSTVRSVVGNWQERANHMFEWQQFEAACENWKDEDDGEIYKFPASTEPAPAQAAINVEAHEREESEIVELAGMVEANTIDARIIEALLDRPDICDRAEIIKLLGCPGEEYDAAIKRIKRVATKIKSKRKE